MGSLLLGNGTVVSLKVFLKGAMPTQDDHEGSVQCCVTLYTVQEVKCCSHTTQTKKGGSNLVSEKFVVLLL